MTADLLPRIIAKLRETPEHRPLYEALTKPCFACAGTGRLTVADLLAMVGPTRRGVDPTPDDPYFTPHESCKGTGRSLHDWDALPDGAMVGPVWKALQAIRFTAGWDAPRKEKTRVEFARTAVVDALGDENTNAAVLAALADWLGMKEEEQHE